MTVSAQDVKNLREKTGAGIMDCKKALTESHGNFDAAADYLKKQGLAKVALKGQRVAAEGLVFAEVDGRAAVIIELNCETDFVARSEEFKKLGETLVKTALLNKVASVDEGRKLKLGHETVATAVDAYAARVGEKIDFRRLWLFRAKKDGQVVVYNHAGGKIVVLIEVTGKKVSHDVCRDIAMHVAAMSPQYLDKSNVPTHVMEKEREIQLAQMKDIKKPAQILEKIISGKLDKFAAELSLRQQSFVKDMSGKKTVQAYLKEIDAEAEVVQFARCAVGEGIEKRQDDFATDVAKMAQH